MPHRFAVPPLYGFFALAAAAILCTFVVPLANWHYGDAGTIDFIQYYSAFRLMIEGKNPYDSSAMYALQQGLGQGQGKVIIAWNPPWTFLLLSPVLTLPYLQSNFLWLLSSAIGLLLIIDVSARAAGAKTVPLGWKVSGIVFMPFYSGLSYGQISIVPAVGVALFYWCVSLGRDRAAGLALVLCSIKPHLFVVAAPYLLYWIVRERRFGVLRGAAVGMAILMAAVCAVNGHALSDWMASFTAPLHPAAVPVDRWKVATIGNVLRTVLASPAGPPSWPMWGVTLATASAATVYVLLTHPRASLAESLLPVLALSVVCSPYGWYYDQTVLLPGQIALLATDRQTRTPHQWLLWAFIGIQLLAAFVQGAAAAEQHHFVWMPLAMIGVWALSRNRRGPRQH